MANFGYACQSSYVFPGILLVEISTTHVRVLHNPYIWVVFHPPYPLNNTDVFPLLMFGDTGLFHITGLRKDVATDEQKGLGTEAAGHTGENGETPVTWMSCWKLGSMVRSSGSKPPFYPMYK